jgi:hypothetical protein
MHTVANVLEASRSQRLNVFLQFRVKSRAYEHFSWTGLEFYHGIVQPNRPSGSLRLSGQMLAQNNVSRRRHAEARPFGKSVGARSKMVFWTAASRDKFAKRYGLLLMAATIAWTFEALYSCWRSILVAAAQNNQKHH